MIPNGLEQNLPQGADICPFHDLKNVPVFFCVRHEVARGVVMLILTCHGTVHGNEWPASRPTRFIPTNITHSRHSVGG